MMTIFNKVELRGKVEQASRLLPRLKQAGRLFYSFLVIAVLCCGLSSCGKPPEHAADEMHHHVEDDTEGGDEGHHDHGNEANGTTFAEGKGILLIDETKDAIGLEMADVAERNLVPIVPVVAQVYRAADEASRPGREQTRSAYATAFLPTPLAVDIDPGDAATLAKNDREFPASVWRIDAAFRNVLNNEQIILRIPDRKGHLRIGEFLSGTVTPSGGTGSTIAVPRSAVLETAMGTFVFVENGKYLLRTPVTTGAQSAEYTEITDGLYTGDVVASQPVELLYLIELRATKGGGHSH